MKVVVIGVPRSGKTSYALGQYRSEFVISTDDILSQDLEWSKRSELITHWMETKTDFCIEGCDAVRGLRKFLKRNPGKSPCDKVIWWGSPREGLSNSQKGFGKGCRKIFFDILPELHELGVEVIVYG